LKHEGLLVLISSSLHFCLQERMREKLLYAITEGQGSFHLS
jgi:hypothetical protein